MPVRLSSAVVAWLFLYSAAGLSAAAGEQGTAKVQRQAAALLRAHQPRQALQLLKPALQQDGDAAGLLTLQGIAYSLEGNNAAAIQSLRRAVRAQPDFLPALRAEAQILVRRQKPDAEAVLVHILALAPSDTTARSMLATEQAQQGKCADAVANFALLADPNSPEAATCLYKLGRFPAAATAFSHLLQQQPYATFYRYDLGLAQLRAGDAASAVRTLQPLVAPDAAKLPDEDTLSLASDANEAAGNTPASVELLRRAIVLDPMQADSYVRFAEICMAHESYQPGIDMVSSGLSRMPHNSALYLARGMLYGGEASYAKAEADFHDAELYDPSHGTGDYGVGIVQLQNNQPEAALTSTRHALQQHPDDPRLNLLLARILLEEDAEPGTRVLAEATAAAAKAVELNPTIVMAHTLLAKADMLAGRTEEAAAECRAALKLDPEDQAALYRLLLASRKLGDTATVEALARRLDVQHQRERDQQTERLRYRLVETPATAAKPVR